MCLYYKPQINPLHAELNPICHLLTLLGAQHIFHVSGLRVKLFLALIQVCGRQMLTKVYVTLVEVRLAKGFTFCHFCYCLVKCGVRVYLL